MYRIGLPGYMTLGLRFPVMAALMWARVSARKSTSAAGSPPSPAAPFRHDSTVQLWVSMEGQPAVLVIDYHPGATSPSCDATQSDIPTCQTGYDLDNTTAFGNPDQDGNHIHAKFGQVWLLPYQTNCCTSGNTDAAADTWFDELIISTKRIPDPLY